MESANNNACLGELAAPARPADLPTRPFAGTRLRPPRILLAEDDLEMRRCLAEALRRARYDVVEAEDGNRVVDYIGACLITDTRLNVDLVISDVRMPGIDGLRILSALRAHHHKLPVILITAFGNNEVHAEARLRGAVAVLDKPFEFDELLKLVRRTLRPGAALDEGSASGETDTNN